MGNISQLFSALVRNVQIIIQFKIFVGAVYGKYKSALLGIGTKCTNNNSIQNVMF